MPNSRRALVAVERIFYG